MSNLLSDHRHVVAVVVTRNRKQLLCRCLQGIVSQTHSVDSVIVLDNASSDGSKEFVRCQGLFQRLNLIWVRLSENTGGAGGFHAGMEAALELFEHKRSLKDGTPDEQKRNYLWLMDDDGFPHPECLAKLLSEMRADVFLGPLVLSDTDSDELAFPFRMPGTLHNIERIDDDQLLGARMVDSVLIPFNGVLISEFTVRKFGLPRKEMFIWGDDIEYTWRLQARGIHVATVVSSHFYHPKSNSVGTPMFFSRMRFNDTDLPVKLYCLARNGFWNYRTYKGVSKAMLFAAKAAWFYLFTKPNVSKFLIVARGIVDGFLCDFTRHNRYY